MNLIEAVRELKEGRCTHIKHKNFGNIHGIYEGREQIFLCLIWSDGGKPFNNATLILSEDWELVNPKPIYEEVEVVKWYSQSEDKIYHEYCTVIPEDAIKIKFPIKKEIKPKIKRRMQIGKVKHFIGNFDTVPADAKLIAEWEE